MRVRANALYACFNKRHCDAYRRVAIPGIRFCPRCGYLLKVAVIKTSHRRTISLRQTGAVDPNLRTPEDRETNRRRRL